MRISVHGGAVNESFSDQALVRHGPSAPLPSTWIVFWLAHRSNRLCRLQSMAPTVSILARGPEHRTAHLFHADSSLSAGIAVGKSCGSSPYPSGARICKGRRVRYTMACGHSSPPGVDAWAPSPWAVTVAAKSPSSTKEKFLSPSPQPLPDLQCLGQKTFHNSPIARGRPFALYSGSTFTSLAFASEA